MVEIKAINPGEIRDGCQIVDSTGDPNEPSDPRAKWHYKIQKIWEGFQGAHCNEETAVAFRNHMRNLCLEFVAEGYLPANLWELHNKISVRYHQTELQIGLPFWIHLWSQTGHIMSEYEVKEYLDDPSVLERFRQPVPSSRTDYKVLY